MAPVRQPGPQDPISGMTNAELIESLQEDIAELRRLIMEGASENARLREALTIIRDKFRHDPKCQSGDSARPGGPPFPCNCHLGVARAALAKAQA